MRLQYNLLAFIASLLRVVDEDSLSEIAQYDPRSVSECFHRFQMNYLYIFIKHEQLLYYFNFCSKHRSNRKA